MIDRVSISQDEDGVVHYGLKTPDGVVVERSAIPANEWKDLRDSIIDQLPGNVSISMLVDYLAIFKLHLEIC